MSELPDYNQRNRQAWGEFAQRFVEPAERAWSRNDPTWGIWDIPEATLKMLPEDMSGMHAVELGCGAAYVSAWMARRGALVQAIDPTPEQLATARQMMARFGPEFALHEGFAERLPFADASFDFAISEYGACLWADPHAWVPEAARVLKPGGRLVFLTNSLFVAICSPDDEQQPSTERMLRPYLGMHRQEWESGSGEVEFHLSHSAWIRLLGLHGFVVERLEELGAPEGAVTRYAWADAEWSRRWPTEEVWFVRKRERGQNGSP